MGALQWLPVQRVQWYFETTEWLNSFHLFCLLEVLYHNKRVVLYINLAFSLLVEYIFIQRTDKFDLVVTVLLSVAFLDLSKLSCEDVVIFRKQAVENDASRYKNCILLSWTIETKGETVVRSNVSNEDLGLHVTYCWVATASLEDASNPIVFWTVSKGVLVELSW